ncbi:MAG: phosphoribosylaminoimidazolesuccinocarboxamide synthase [Dehalococcoidia bacterium]
MSRDPEVLMKADLPLPVFRRGKVRDVYDLGDRLLIVSTDRISAFDVVLPCGIPGKGEVLTGLAAFWFEKTSHIVSNHMMKVVDQADIEGPIQKAAQDLTGREWELPGYLVGRSMLVAKAERVPVESVVRGYLSGSAWEEYTATGRVGEIRLPSGMKESEEFPEPIFTPTTKSDTEHDRLMTDRDIRELGVESTLGEVEEKSMLVYRYARDYARERGIIIADTKFEFGFIDGRLSLIDELLTPDSSRFWEASQYEVGRSQPSFDKQPVRDWLASSGWDRKPPAPMLPQEVIDQTSSKYRDVYRRLTGSVPAG